VELGCEHQRDLIAFHFLQGMLGRQHQGRGHAVLNERDVLR
jgi:hypothetical protein